MKEFQLIAQRERPKMNANAEHVATEFEGRGTEQMTPPALQLKPEESEHETVEEKAAQETSQLVALSEAPPAAPVETAEPKPVVPLAQLNPPQIQLKSNASEREHKEELSEENPGRLMASGALPPFDPDKGSYIGPSVQMKEFTPGNSVIPFQYKSVQNTQLQQIADGKQVHQLKADENNTGLPDNLKSGVENLSGFSMDDVKVHYNSDKPAQLSAHAYAQGSDIHLASGQEKHLPHEAWHVVQQKQGRVQPTKQMKGKVNVNDDAGLEKEADVKGAKAVTENAHPIQKKSYSSENSSTVIQKVDDFERWRRIIGRKWNKKSLPTNTYRWDARPPENIAVHGFQPWNPQGTIRLDEHVNNVFNGGANHGELAKYESQWVSTGAYGMLKKLDPTFANQVFNTHLYKIDTAAASTTGNFSDANDYFDKHNMRRPYASQREWVKDGGIPPNAVIEWMSGQVFIDQYDLTNGAPDEAQLTGWQPMPAPTNAQLDDDETSSDSTQLKEKSNSGIGNPVQLESKDNSTGLPDNLKSGVENLSGFSMDDVKVHYNSDKPAQLYAHAYAQGSDIHLASGQEKHLPHEAWHVVQQKQGRVQPTRQMKGKTPINDNEGLEKEADVMGAKAATDFNNALPVQQPDVVENSNSADFHPVQRVNNDGTDYTNDEIRNAAEHARNAVKKKKAKDKEYAQEMAKYLTENHGNATNYKTKAALENKCKDWWNKPSLYADEAELEERDTMVEPTFNFDDGHGDLHFINKPSEKKSAWDLSKASAKALMEAEIAKYLDVLGKNSSQSEEQGWSAFYISGFHNVNVGRYLQSGKTGKTTCFTMQVQVNYVENSITYHGFPDQRAENLQAGCRRTKYGDNLKAE